MKSKLIVLPSILILASSAFLLFTHYEQVFGQDARPQIQRPALAVEETLSNLRADESAVEATGLPRSDLTIKEMCLKSGSLDSVHVLLANIGSTDAGPFELGFEYMRADGTGRLTIEPISGLRAGEEKWL